LRVEPGDLIICKSYGLENVLPVEVLHATCVFNAEEKLYSFAYEVQDSYKDRKDVEMFGGWSSNSEESVKGIHDCEVLAWRAPDKDDVMNGGTSLLGNCEGLSNGLAIIGNEIPDISEVSNRDALFVELPLMRLKGVSELISNDWADAGVKFSHEHDCWLRLGDFSDRGGGASGAVKEADEHVGQGSIRG
jgi:hypothetical protein